MTIGESDRATKKLKLARGYIHINPEKGNIMVDKLSPVVILRKIKLGPSDASGFATVTDLLPELTEADDNQDLESQRVNHKTQPVQNEEVSFINTLTQEELNDHVQQCLEMSTENKINLKNAFALKLIDCFSYLQKKKDFSAMACTLDAGTKIYSCRVDALHQQVMKLADEVVKTATEKKTDKEDKDGDNLTAGGKSKKTRRNNFIASSENLKRKMKTKDPKEKYLRLEALPGAILNTARRDPNDLSLSLECSIPFWPNWDNYKPLKATGVVPLPDVKIFREKSETGTTTAPPQISHEPDQHITDVECSFDDFIDADHIFEETPPSHEFVSIVDNPISDPHSGNDEDNHSVADDVVENASTTGRLGEGEADVVATAMERLQQEAEADGAVNRGPTRVEALKILFDLSSEYNYLLMKNCNYWAGPEFWKRPKGGTESGKEKIKVTNKRKEPGEIVYDFKDMDERLLKLRKGATCLTERTLRGWKNKKTTLPIDLNVNSSWFLNLFHVEKCGATSKESEHEHSKPTNFVDVMEQVEDVEYITANSSDPLSSDAEDEKSSQDPVDATFYEAASGHSLNSEPRDPMNCTFYDAGPSNKESGKILRVEISSSVTADFGESYMVPKPKMVNVDPIKYSTRPIRVDMQHLKRAMMDVIREEIENDAREKEIQRGVHDNGVAAWKPEVRFRDVLKNLPRKLERRTREDLSTAIAFTAVLSLANEHSLQLEKCEDGDFVVRLPDLPDPVFEEDSGDEPHSE